MAPFDDCQESEWSRKGGTLTDRTARKEFGLTQEELAQAFKAGKLQARRTWIYGNPCLRLLRREVEALVKSRRGGDYLRDQQTKAELALVNRELRQLKKQIAALEKRKAKLMEQDK
jgi:hypothetical protein